MPRPQPEPTLVSAPYWEATGRDELLLQHCEGCGEHQYYPRSSCTTCGARPLEWVPASGRGIVFSYTVAHRPTHPMFADRVPMVIALVELEEGPRMTTNIVDADPADV